MFYFRVILGRSPIITHCSLLIISRKRKRRHSWSNFGYIPNLFFLQKKTTKDLSEVNKYLNLSPPRYVYSFAGVLFPFTSHAARGTAKGTQAFNIVFYSGLAPNNPISGQLLTGNTDASLVFVQQQGWSQFCEKSPMRGSCHRPGYVL